MENETVTYSIEVDLESRIDENKCNPYFVVLWVYDKVTHEKTNCYSDWGISPAHAYQKALDFYITFKQKSY